jgi:hypothetical protein
MCETIRWKRCETKFIGWIVKKKDKGGQYYIVEKREKDDRISSKRWGERGSNSRPWKNESWGERGSNSRPQDNSIAMRPTR